MKAAEINKQFASDEEYLAFEDASEIKHELINGILYETSGSSKYHNALERHLANLIEKLIGENKFEVYTAGFNVHTPNGNFLYPDIIVSTGNTERYFTKEPVLLVEVLSEATRKFDLTDKFIQYQKFDSLKYYLCIEPEQQVIIFYFKNSDGEWPTETHTKDGSMINLPALGISFSLKDVYSK